MRFYNLSNAQQQWVVILTTLLVTFIPVFLIELRVLGYTNGVFMYPLDDTFIHMEVAGNIVQHKTWGINPGQFGSASSSILYTTLLALVFSIFSVHDIIPFVINCIAAGILIFAMQQWLQKKNVNYIAQILILILAIFFGPLPVLIVSGMEHTLQCLFSFLFIFSFADWYDDIGKSGKAKSWLPWRLLLFGLLTATIRYEGLFLIAIACFILLLKRSIRNAVLLGVISVLPVLLFGIYSISKGSYFLPNSVLVKSDSIQFTLTGILHFFSTLLLDKLTLAKSGIAALATQRLLLILPVCYLFLRYRFSIKSSEKIILMLLLAGTVLHLSFSATGWLYRYEAYLIFCSVFAIAYLFYKYGNQQLIQQAKQVWIVALAAIFFLIFPLVLRSTTALLKTTQACRNIYDQQYQMAQFSKKFYNNKVVAANDIGAVSYFNDSKILDLWGLATIEVARSRKNNYWTPAFIDSLCKKQNAKLIMIYDSWFNKALTQHWTKVATWQIQNNVICGDDMVSFYTIMPEDSAFLKQQLIEFQSSLPPSVAVQYY